MQPNHMRAAPCHGNLVRGLIRSRLAVHAGGQPQLEGWWRF